MSSVLAPGLPVTVLLTLHPISRPSVQLYSRHPFVMQRMSVYTPPLSLTIVSSISIGIAALFSLWILFDIIHRRGWKSMMAVMCVTSPSFAFQCHQTPLMRGELGRIPVYVVNALYLAPLTLWTYLQYGRPTKPTIAPSQEQGGCSHHRKEPSGVEQDLSTSERRLDGEGGPDSALYDLDESHQHHNMSGHGHSHEKPGRPMFAIITVAVCHCGAGCVLGDIVGEWLIYGAGAEINGRALWVEYLVGTFVAFKSRCTERINFDLVRLCDIASVILELEKRFLTRGVDFGFALLFGIFFQYFSIAPMSSNFGPATIYRAAKADFLSLTFFEVGLFGWMAIFQIAIFQWRLEMTTVTYWWMMQVYTTLRTPETIESL